jgi:hypothetical protein
MMKQSELSETEGNQVSSVTVTVLRHLATSVTLATILGAAGCVPEMGTGEQLGPDAGTGSGSGMQTPADAAPVDIGPFDLDCAKTANQMTPHCARPGSVMAGSLGSGPAFVEPGLGDLYGGFVDGNRLIAAMAYSAAPATGAVVAVDLDTGDRTVISGSYNDATAGRKTIGTGPDWGTVNDVQPGPDGWYAITSLGVYRIDPATGTRTLVIDHANTATRCTVGTTTTKAIPRKDTIAVGPDKSVYLSLSNSPAGSGVGLVAVKAGVCKIISLGGGPAGSAVGSGATFTNGYLRSIRFREGKVWGVELVGKSLMTFDPATLNRSRLSASGTTKVGSGDADVGVGWFGFPTTGQNPVYTTWYDTLNRQAHIVPIDPANGARAEMTLAPGPANKGGASYPPIWVHPSKPWLLLSLDNAIVQVDIATGASYTLSR